MRKIAVISDIHANIDALKLVFLDIERNNVDEIVCLGDLVTKYFYPSEVVDMVRKNAFIVVKGNCDWLVSSDERYKFARAKLGLDRIEYLANLPIINHIFIDRSLVNFYHSVPYDLTSMFNPLFTFNNMTSYKDKVISDYNKMFLAHDGEISFMGHTHQHYIGMEVNNELAIVDDNVNVNSFNRVLVNVGGVGEHIHMCLNNDGVYRSLIDDYITYGLISYGNKNDINIEIKKISYVDTLEKVYFSMIDMQNKELVPYSPNDTNRVYESLVSMKRKVRKPDLIKR